MISFLKKKKKKLQTNRDGEGMLKEISETHNHIINKMFEPCLDHDSGNVKLPSVRKSKHWIFGISEGLLIF